MRLHAVHEEHPPVACVPPDLARHAVVLRVVPLPGAFHRVELNNDASLRPTTFENADRTPRARNRPPRRSTLGPDNSRYRAAGPRSVRSTSTMTYAATAKDPTALPPASPLQDH